MAHATHALAQRLAANLYRAHAQAAGLVAATRCTRLLRVPDPDRRSGARRPRAPDLLSVAALGLPALLAALTRSVRRNGAPRRRIRNTVGWLLRFCATWICRS